jgi:hypothetical protein
MKYLTATLTLCLLFLVSACSPNKARENPLDPMGSAFSNSLITFKSTNFTFTYGSGTYPFIDNGILGWPETTTVAISNFSFYYSFGNPTLTSNAKLYSNFPGTILATNVKLNNGANYWWVEALGVNGRTNIFSVNYTFNTSESGFKWDGSTGSNATGSLVCANVPLGGSKKVTFQTVTVGSTPTAISLLNGAYKVYQGSSGLVLTIIFSNYSAGAFCQGTISITNQPASFIPFSMSVATGVPTTTSVCYLTLIVSNGLDQDGINGIWIDDFSTTWGSTICTPSWPYDFLSQPSGMSGDLGNWK